MRPYGDLGEVCFGCTDRIYPTKEHPYTCHATCEKYKRAKAKFEKQKRRVRKKMESDSEADIFTIDSIRRTK